MPLSLFLSLSLPLSIYIYKILTDYIPIVQTKALGHSGSKSLGLGGTVIALACMTP